MTKDEFYREKIVVATEWWLETSLFPDLVWARIRLFGDGTADACWYEGGELYGFENAEYAGYFLSEDEYSRFNSMDEEDEKGYGISLKEILPPAWKDNPEAAFKYLGTY